jgi:hypothetical protein
VRRKLEKPDVSKIYGRIQYVESFPHYRVQVVDGMADLDVQEVESLPNGPGLWQVVDEFPDYRIQIVDALSDFEIRFINRFPDPKF